MKATKDMFVYVYGSKSHVNLAGKILLGVPMFPFMLFIAFGWDLLEFLFTKKGGV